MTKRKLLIGLIAIGSLLSATRIGVMHSLAQVENRRSELMRRKLEYSKNILEGLTRENFTMITDGATSLKALSEASEWGMGTIPNVDQYLAYIKDFQRLTDELSKKASTKSVDGATLARYCQFSWMEKVRRRWSA